MDKVAALACRARITSGIHVIYDHRLCPATGECCSPNVLGDTLGGSNPLPAPNGAATLELEVLDDGSGARSFTALSS